jgi:precorrin-3B synthase
VNALRRGACPSVADPMPTGDGLLARLLPDVPMPLHLFVALCGAAQEHGNGIMEVTQRGSFQFRGLRPASAAPFADTVAALGFGAVVGPPIVTPPLLGLQAQESVDLQALAATLRLELIHRTDLAALSPKVSLLIDGEGALHLDDVMADVRVRAADVPRLHLSIAGTAATATSLGWVESHQAVGAILYLLASLAARGPAARARDLVNESDLAAIRASLADVLVAESPPPPRSRSEPIGMHALNKAQFACGVALPFGHADARTLLQLAASALRCGATAIRPVPGRALLTLGLTAMTADEFAAAATLQGFIVRAADVRRYVVACAGAPACGSAMLSTRQLAPAIADAAESLLDGSTMIHLSGCTKGCAHPKTAALTLVGPDRIVVQGRANDAPHGKITPAALLAGLGRLQADPSKSPFVAGRAARVVESLGGEIST